MSFGSWCKKSCCKTKSWQMKLSDAPVSTSCTWLIPIQVDWVWNQLDLGDCLSWIPTSCSGVENCVENGNYNIVWNWVFSGVNTFAWATAFNGSADFNGTVDLTNATIVGLPTPTPFTCLDVQNCIVNTPAIRTIIDARTRNLIETWDFVTTWDRTFNWPVDFNNTVDFTDATVVWLSLPSGPSSSLTSIVPGLTNTVWPAVWFSTASTTYVDKITSTVSVWGWYRITFDMEPTQNAFTAFAQIYKNWVIESPEYQRTWAWSLNVSYDINVNAWDVILLKARASWWTWMLVGWYLISYDLQDNIPFASTVL